MTKTNAAQRHQGSFNSTKGWEQDIEGHCRLAWLPEKGAMLEPVRVLREAQFPAEY